MEKGIKVEKQVRVKEIIDIVMKIFLITLILEATIMLLVVEKPNYFFAFN